MQTALSPERRYALPRNIYHTAEKFVGQWVWFAITSQGVMIGPYRARDYEEDADVVALLIVRLDELDPVARHLALVPDEPRPTASVGAHAFRSWLLGARGSPPPASMRAPSVPRTARPRRR
jgi:hypothetical protein